MIAEAVKIRDQHKVYEEFVLARCNDSKQDNTQETAEDCDHAIDDEVLAGDTAECGWTSGVAWCDDGRIVVGRSIDCSSFR